MSGGDGQQLISVSGTDVSNNDVGGDLNIGSIVVKLPSIDLSVSADALRKLIEQHERLKEDDPIYAIVIDELQSKIRNSPSRKVVGLENKLIAAGRAIYLDSALISSQKASRAISRLQHVRSYQIIFNHILSLILTRFNSHVLPLLRQDCGDIVVSTTINAAIVEPLYREMVMVGGVLGSDVVEGMLYFLTEKCHVEWV